MKPMTDKELLRLNKQQLVAYINNLYKELHTINTHEEQPKKQTSYVILQHTSNGKA